MKRIFFVIAAIFVVGVVFTACKENKKTEEKVEIQESHEQVKVEDASKQAFHCTSADCDASETYDKAGDCPVCKSKLAVKVADAEPALTASCSCKSGGDCACVGGCKCTA